MLYKKSRRKKWALLALCAGGTLCLALFSRVGSSSDSSTPHSDDSIVSRDLISAQLGEAIKDNRFPETFDLKVDGETLQASVEYGLEYESHERMERLFRSYRPDYGAFVAMDATTGRILSLISYTRDGGKMDNLALRASFPAASIFKVVTAGAALDMDKANPNTIVPFNGSYHTLYKRNVEETKPNRWTRRMTLREAFGRSVNVFFGKLGLFYIGPQDLLDYAERFRFNQPIRSDIPVEMGHAKISADDPWSVVTAASGFTRENTMSPIQGAMIAAAVANDGVMMEPYLVEAMTDQKGVMIYQAEPRQASIAVEPRSAAELRVLVRETIRSLR
jgi:cell division protein FtsI/penicillin-binding protein 2